MLEATKQSKEFNDIAVRRELTQRGITGVELARKSGTSRADVSNFLNSHLERIGRKRREAILATLGSLGISVTDGEGMAGKCPICSAHYETAMAESEQQIRR